MRFLKKPYKILRAAQEFREISAGITI